MHIGDLGARQVYAGRGSVWWDPNGVGLSCVGAYRAINSVGTPWGGGPTAYAQSLVNQVTPGINDLVEGNGAVPWVQATGWDFVAAAVQYFDTGLVPANDQSWSMFVQFSNYVLGGNRAIAGVNGGGNTFFWLRDSGGVVAEYGNGQRSFVAPPPGTGNLGVAGAQGYRDGIADGGAIGAWGAPSVFSVYIGARNGSGVASWFGTVDIESAAVYSGGAAAVQAEALAIATAMAAL
jgi:hypothetical protein